MVTRSYNSTLVYLNGILQTPTGDYQWPAHPFEPPPDFLHFPANGSVLAIVELQLMSVKYWQMTEGTWEKVI